MSHIIVYSDTPIIEGCEQLKADTGRKNLLFYLKKSSS